MSLRVLGGVCRAQEESAGKTRKRNRWSRAALVEAAHSAIETKTYLGVPMTTLVRPTSIASDGIRVTLRLTQRLERLGYNVRLEPITSAA